MNEHPDLAALLLDGDYAIRPGGTVTPGLTASRGLAVRRLLDLATEDGGDKDDFFGPCNE